tara:strand:- start:191 stop:469 length:279 start_codon:yes stop_codon:yes gene_type:complete
MTEKNKKQKNKNKKNKNNMSWKEIFKDDNKYNEKSIIGFLAFLIMVIVMLADVITGWIGKDLVINEAIYNSFVMVVLGCFGIAGLEKFANRK